MKIHLSLPELFKCPKKKCNPDFARLGFISKNLYALGLSNANRLAIFQNSSSSWLGLDLRL
ncbi:hypothetical protein BpHYR1_012725 [Brachionus plicatilis]|uniref:Uncharacterized protein n=1 Tax=Brachionus plicatilis TaxID=10195 RepID=A0A3M7T0U6_BRAPC|nr:hypothetical protein BpHYR1_012725 [Brachionus plicatilis]